MIPVRMYMVGKESAKLHSYFYGKTIDGSITRVGNKYRWSILIGKVRFVSKNGEAKDFEEAVSQVCTCLEDHFNDKVILLIGGS